MWPRRRVSDRFRDKGRSKPRAGADSELGRAEKGFSLGAKQEHDSQTACFDSNEATDSF